MLVNRQGCCIDAFNNVINDGDVDIDVDLEEVYDDCNIDVPDTGCNNSPLRGGSSLPQTSFISTVTVLLAVFVNGFMGYDKV